MKRTLLICNVYPLPEDHGNNMRTMNFVRFFKNYGTLDIVYFVKHIHNQVKHYTFLNEYFLKNENSSKSFKRRFIAGLVKGNPIPVRCYDKASQRFLSDLIKNNDYNYIIVRYIINASFIFKLGTRYKRRTIIDFDDIITDSLYESRFGSVESWYKKGLLSLNKKSLRNYEKKCLNFGAALFCSEKDRVEMAKEHQNSKTFVVPNIYANRSFEQYDFGVGFKKRNILLFVGELSYRPNSDGLKWFIESVFPDFKKKYSDGRLIVVGRRPKENLKNLCNSIDGIELFSDVPDVKKFYAQCRAVIVPILSGGGTRIKILEAMLANSPVLSTAKGAEGLDLLDKTNVLLFENSNEFCIKYNMLKDERKYYSLVENAKNTVLNRYSVNRFNYAMEEVLGYLESH